MSIKQCVNRFLTDRNYAIGWALFTTALVAGFLSLFLITKVVTEVVNWTDSSGEYATNTISVNAIGEVVAVPDVATFSFGVVEEAESVEAAQEASSKKMNLAIAFLKENGVDEDDIKTTNFSVNPRYEYSFCNGFDCPPTRERQLISYEVNQRVQVKVKNTDDAGKIIAGITALEVTNLSGLQFTIDDTDALKEEAQSLAVKNARAKAERLADDLGVKLKKVINFSSNDGGYGDEFGYAEARAFDSVSKSSAIIPDIPIGENTITSQVYITYEIK